MSNGATAAIIVLIVIIIVALILLAMVVRRRRLQRLFGPEYDRVVTERESRTRGEAELTERQRRVRGLHIQPLTEAQRARYWSRWQAIQEQFVDSPAEAVAEAYSLVTAVMRERGYPVSDDDQISADLSVDHARTVEHFRAAQAIAREVAHGSVVTEDLRQALIHYRALFADLLGTPADGGQAGQAVAQADLGPEPVQASTVIQPNARVTYNAADVQSENFPQQQGR